MHSDRSRLPRLYQRIMVVLRSPVAPSLRMVIMVSAQHTTPASTMATASIGMCALASSARSRHGRMMTSTPPSPANTAPPRRQPTRSPSSGTESTVRNSGMANPSAVMVASGSRM